jgi:methionyl-tRNA formyltransferase
MELAALFTVKERGKHYMDITDHRDLTAKYKIPVCYVANINDADAVNRMRALQPDYVMSLGWKQIVKDEMLSIPRIGWLGGHPAYLPLKGERPDPTTLTARGNEPLQYAIRGNYQKTGMSLQWVEAKIDLGLVFDRELLPLDEHETSYTLLHKMGRASAEMLRHNMPSLLAGKPPRLEQEPVEAQAYMKPLHADDNKIDLSAAPAEAYRLIRSCIYPYPNAFIEFHGQRIYVESARMENRAFTELKVRSGGTPWGIS